MSNSALDAFAIALMRAEQEDRPVTLQRRTPDQNNPMAPIPVRAARRTQRSYADPTGETAVGNRKRKR